MPIFLLLLVYNIFAANAHPNFVVVLTDDQDLILDGLTPMGKTLELIGGKGKVFNNAFANSPICCPSRSSILTGKFVHNTGVFNNSIEGNCSSPYWQEHHEPYSIVALLKDSKNYTTFYAGKYMNQYGTKEAGGISHVPKGYDWWIGLQGNSKYYNYTLSVNGTEVFHEDVYLTDLLSNYSIDFLRDKPADKPFFMIVAPPAAHAPFTPAERHKNMFPEVKAVRSPSFNFTSSQKHWLVQMSPSHLPSNVSILDETHKHRQQTLLAVDEMVERIFKELEESEELENTYIIFTSDNGFHIGQFAQPWDKRQPYETDIRVPFIISGPDIPLKITENYPILLVDIAPTILDLAGTEIPDFMDGRSFKEALLSDETKLPSRQIFFEYWGEGESTTIDSSCPWKDDENLSFCIVDQWCKCQDSRNNTYTCVVTLSESDKFKYCSFRDNQHFREAYNLTLDPYELDNVYAEMDKGVVGEYDGLLENFQNCRGSGCWL
ncbi:N-acetylglucosamine-6-sulfatase-like [Anoplophora glabripennis]|uniref:N-acetylglucosamine-6-sulfatase-like n=1 Tax=Anoplophora glabripennis TaxID=217634 RepID=UPI0008735395|nr:N-acetylglucosamine-6-sulfatase-like [Anoplophora glabripennis]